MFVHKNNAMTNRAVRSNAHKISKLDDRIDALHNGNIITFYPVEGLKYLVSADNGIIELAENPATFDVLIADSDLTHVDGIDRVTVFGEVASGIVSDASDWVFGDNDAKITSMTIESVTPLAELINTTSTLENVPAKTHSSFRFITESLEGSLSIGGNPGSVDIGIQALLSGASRDDTHFWFDSSFIPADVADGMLSAYVSGNNNDGWFINHMYNDQVLKDKLVLVRTGGELEKVTKATVKYQ